MTWTKTGNIKGPAGSGNLTIVQNGDVASPATGAMWIKEDVSVAGQAMGMMGMTYADNTTVFADTLSIKLTNRIARVVL